METTYAKMTDEQRAHYDRILLARMLPVLSPHPGGELLPGCVDCDRLRKNRDRMRAANAKKERAS